MGWKKLILVGDSITQYGYSSQGKWVSMLSDYLQPKCDVLNRGFAGYTSKELRKLVPAIFEEFDVKDIAGVVIMLGSNDSAGVRRTSPVYLGCQLTEGKTSFLNAKDRQPGRFQEEHE